MQWEKIIVELGREAIDLVSQIMIDAGCAGTEIEERDGTFWVTGYLPHSIDLSKRLHSIADALRRAGREVGGIVVESLRHEPVASQDWAESWKENFTPLDVGQRFRIQPSWIEPPAAADASGRVLLTVDPGMAFGTGQHVTTRFCLELLEKFAQPGRSLLDIGTGTGILAIAGYLLGARPVTALDNDPLAIEAAIKNVRRNLGIEPARLADEQASLRVHLGDFADLSCAPCDMVTANLTSEQIMRLLPQMSRLLVPGGCFIGSGISFERWAEVEKALDSAGLSLAEVLRTPRLRPRDDEGWIGFAAYFSSA